MRAISRILADMRGDPRYVFVEGDIGDRDLVVEPRWVHTPRALINFAAESQC